MAAKKSKAAEPINLVQFLKLVDQKWAMLAPAEQATVAHEWARRLPADQRATFLAVLKPAPAPVADSAALQKRWTELAAQLKQATQLDRAVVQTYNEDYDDWDNYQDDEPEFYYDDPGGVAEIIEAVSPFLQDCLAAGADELAAAALQQLLALKVPIENDEGEVGDTTFDLEELVANHVVNIAWRDLVALEGYLAYRTTPLAQRPAAVYQALQRRTSPFLSFEDLMQYGRELPDLAAFLPKWRAYLGQQTTLAAQRLLKEALGFAADPALEVAMAAKVAKQHPSVYANLIQSTRQTAQTPAQQAALLKMGQRALADLPTHYVIRGQIAVWLIPVADALGESQVAADLRLAAFASWTNLANYWALRFDPLAWQQGAQQVDQILAQRFDSASLGNWRWDERAANAPSKETLTALRFLQGDYAAMVAELPAHPGWWHADQQVCCLLMLLLLAAPASLTAERLEVAHRMLSLLEVGQPVSLPATQQFWRSFGQWRQSQSITAAQAHEWLEWLSELVDDRVADIMATNQRKKYREAAALIACLGAAQVNWHTAPSAQGLMAAYQAKYSRRWAFREELESFGFHYQKKRK